jgi:hypothetical protein
LAVWALDDDFPKVFQRSDGERPAGLAISTEGDLLAVASRTLIEVIDLKTKLVKRTFPVSDPWGLELAFLETPAVAAGRVSSVRMEQAPSDWLAGRWLLVAENSRCRILAVDQGTEVELFFLPGRCTRPIACSRHRTGFAIQAAGQVLTWTYPARLSTRRGSGDLQALAEGKDRYPFCVLAQSDMTIVQATGNDSVIACFPLPLNNICMHPDGRTWCGTYGREVYFLRLEGIENHC